MGQVDRLANVAHFAEKLEHLFRPHLVEGLHDVDRDKRHGLTEPGELAVNRQS